MDVREAEPRRDKAEDICGNVRGADLTTTNPAKQPPPRLTNYFIKLGKGALCFDRGKDQRCAVLEHRSQIPSIDVKATRDTPAIRMEGEEGCEVDSCLHAPINVGDEVNALGCSRKAEVGSLLHSVQRITTVLGQ